MSKPKNIAFSYNWNRKLDNKCFTTIRLSNDSKYQVGEVYDIYEKETYRGPAKLVEKRKIHLEKMNEFIARLDTGYPAGEAKKILRRMYKKENPLLDLLLLEYV